MKLDREIVEDWRDQAERRHYAIRVWSLALFLCGVFWVSAYYYFRGLIE